MLQKHEQESNLGRNSVAEKRRRVPLITEVIGKK